LACVNKNKTYKWAIVVQGGRRAWLAEKIVDMIERRCQRLHVRSVLASLG